MRGLMMDFPLTVPVMTRRAETLFGAKTVASRRPGKAMVRHSYSQIIERTRRLAGALAGLGVKPGDRVATLAWASHEHLEAYLGIPSLGAVLHTLNLRLHHDDLIYIVNDAQDRVLIVDESLLPLAERVLPHTAVEHVIVTARTGAPLAAAYIDYEQLIAGVDPARFTQPDIDEFQAAAMCYTSGTTGQPKGVLYSHRAIVLHSLASGLHDGLAVSEMDTVLPIVPMFHVNAWGLPFSTTFLGANQVLPGPFLDPSSVLQLLVSERVTLSGGVPTVWLGVLEELDKNPGTYDLRCLRTIVIGGSAPPPAMIRAYQERHGVTILHAWGMTEMSPLGTICTLPSRLCDAPSEEQFRYRMTQGTPLPLVEIRARTDEGLVPWDAQTMGELEVRGPWVASAYYNVTGRDHRFTDDGWFRTGDIVTISDNGCIELTDRAKDLVKSGGEWISSVALENSLMGHPAIAEAAVIAVPHPKWDERPLAVVVLKPGRTTTCEELVDYLESRFAKWWVPDIIEFVPEIPRTSAGKFKKSELREKYRGYYKTA